MTAATRGAPIARASTSRFARLVGVLAISNTISWDILFYSFAVFLPTTATALAASQAAVSGALTLAVLLSAVVGIPVGRYLDRHAGRRPMTAGSVAAAGLVVAWSQTDSLWLLYLVWAAIGITMAAVLYEPTFIVLTKALPEPGQRRRSITLVTLLAALASFIFLPLAQTLLDHRGRQNAILILAAILLIPIALHLMLPGHLDGVETTAAHRSGARGPARRILRRVDFRLLTLGYMLATLAAVGPLVVLIPYIRDKGFSAAFAVGIIGAAQLPGRLLFVALEHRVSQRAGVILTFTLVAFGLVLAIIARSPVIVLVATSLLGIGKGMTTLSRATLLADRFGTTDYGAIASITAAATTTATAAAPLLASTLSDAAGTTLVLWVLTGCAFAATLTILPVPHQPPAPVPACPT